MAMISYPELVAALSSWRARKGLPTEQPPAFVATGAATSTPARSMPIPARAAAPVAAAAAFETIDDDEIDEGDLDIVAEEEDGVAEDEGEATAIAGAYEGDEDVYADAGTLDVGDDEVIDEGIASGEIGGSPPPLAPPPDDDDNPWK